MIGGKKRKLTVYIGRFSPFHKGHAETLERALNLSERVLVIIGSADQPRTIKNPWTALERAEMIVNWNSQRNGYGDDVTFNPLYDGSNVIENLGRLILAKQRDYRYNEQRWLADVQETVSKFEPEDVWLTGADRDDSTFYLKMFPNYLLDLVHEDREVSKFLTATSIRDIYFGSKLNQRPLSEHESDLLSLSFVPEVIAKRLKAFKLSGDYERLVQEYEFQLDHDRRWLPAPFTPIFHTVDAVVIQTGHVLLVRRRNTPGKGLWALPGGYLNPSEWMIDGAIRELNEETKIDVPEPVIRGSLVDRHTFEAPDRSLRGRIITDAFCFQLPDFVSGGRVKLPKVKGSDDAAKAKWFPLSQVMNMSDQLFEDHFDIIETMIARLRDKT